MALIQLPRPGSISLRRLADELRREFAAANRIDGQLVDRDIAARRHEAAGGRLWANQRDVFNVNWQRWASPKTIGANGNSAAT